MSTTALPDPRASVQQTIKKLSSLATLPEVTARIVAIVEDPRSSPNQLHKIVSHDPALVTRILKVVNSAFYGLPGQIASVERAIVLLGLNAVKNIAVAASLGQLFRGIKLCEGYTARDLWTHCIAVGVTARQIARELKLPVAEEAFLAGMIHDVGLLVQLQTAPDKLMHVCERAKVSRVHFVELEREIVGMDHQQLGAALCEQWKFPRPCQLVAGYHHAPSSLTTDNRLLVTLVATADTLCCAENRGFSLTALNQKLEETGMNDLGIDAAIVEQVRASIPALVSNSAAIFS